MPQIAPLEIEPIDACRYRIPPQGRMNVPGIVFADERLMAGIREDQALRQVANVACLPGIVHASLAMPDIHWGYGFPIGGVAAFDLDRGVISPGGVGYDINCGVRLLRSRVSAAEAEGRLRELVEALCRNLLPGVGYRVCDGFLQVRLKASRAHGIDLPAPQLCCAPIGSEEGRRYLGAMYAAANFAFGNRQVITHSVRQSFQEVFSKGPRDLGLE